MKNYPKYIKNMLQSVIQDMAKHSEDFCRCPEKDFTRNRKLPFGKVLTLLVKKGGHYLREEMLNCLDFADLPASVSALVQQGSKILPHAMEYLFHQFTDTCERLKMSSEVQQQIKEDLIRGFPVKAFAGAHIQQSNHKINIILCHIAETSLF